MIDIHQKDLKQTDHKLITNLIAEPLIEGHAISLWRLPNCNKKNILVCSDGIQKLDEVVLEDAHPGFVFSPFERSEKKLYLKANQLYIIEDGELVQDTGTSGTRISDPIQIKKVEEPNCRFHTKKTSYPNASDKSAYVNLVDKCIEVIAANVLEKIVPSRLKLIDLNTGFDPLECFNKLCYQYPNAFVSLVSTPEEGTWIGASPELLVSVDSQMKFRTAAVAGTQILTDETDLKQIAWTQKEIEEQALVSRYIINCFKQIRLREFEEHGPKTCKAGNLLHLKTDFEVDMVATSFPQLGSVMLVLLHPTSAVCGMPGNASLKFLEENEGLKRDFYSGYLGPVNIQNETNIYVNLRCMQWRGQRAILYAGAGVTIDSDPEKEWEETEMKMNTLLQVIQS